jgi:hypothetical protein
MAQDSKLDGSVVLGRSFDQDTNRVRVDAEVSATIGTVSVVIDAAGGDNIAISDGVDTLAINADGSINVTGPVTNAQLRASPIETTTGKYATRLDEASATVTYVGEAVL